MSQYNTYQTSTTHSNVCNYHTLGAYHQNPCAMAPVPSVVKSGYMVVPSYTAPGYMSVSRATPGCGEYHSINTAYGASGQCQSAYQMKACGGQ